MLVDLTNLIDMVNPAYLEFMQDYSHETYVLMGGAGSGKSHAIVEKIIVERLLSSHNERGFAIRKVKNDLKDSCYDAIKNKIFDWGLESLFNFKLSPMEIECKATKSKINFKGLDDPEKWKSIERITFLWFEEASEITEKEYDKLILRMRANSSLINQSFISFNPIYEELWLNDRFFKKYSDKVFILVTTYRDNKYLPQQYIDTLENLEDEYLKAVYRDGLWGTVGNRIFTNWVVEDFNINDYYDTEILYKGIDFGFIHKNAYMIYTVNDNTKEIRILKELAGSKWLNSEFIDKCKKFDPEYKTKKIFGDTANPDKIKEFNTAGFPVAKAHKGAGSVNSTIDFLCRYRIVIHKDCVHTQKEFKTYQWAEKRNKGVIPEPIPETDFMSFDCIAALRYGVSNRVKMNKFGMRRAS